MTTDKLDIPVAWRFSDPPLAARSWHDWDAAPTLGAAADRALDRRLGWPEGTVAVLQAAFGAKLGRAVGWQGQAPAVKAAAAVYKRGVAHREHAAALSPSHERSGRYALHVTATPPEVAELCAPDEFQIVDGNVLRLWPAIPHTARQLAMALFEQDKTLATVALVLDTWRNLGRPKRWVVIGGGILADVAAFAASLAHADVRFVPTTLLAMADACVGGKTGVNFAPFGKNQVGAFYFPTSVDVWTGWLATLPARDLRAGAAECIKHAFLAGDLALADEIAAAIAAGALDRLTPLMPRIIAFKADVVAEDPSEAGKRAILNLGHTLGHALEAVSQARTPGGITLLHGEAVGVGIAYALLLSHAVAGLPTAALDRMLAALATMGALLPRSELARRLAVDDLASDATFELLWQPMTHDKKNAAVVDAQGEWVLLAAPGATARSPDGGWTIPVAKPAAKAAWASLLARSPS